ncbi:YbaB/EbfC family DNA-binding protein [Mycobacterium sp. 050128]|uniref:YbaB/EbfC family DNA-binding protein n=1 Tax=Mycobacterium sp. 050128 TaxID=3096112 RepID=UPI002ED96E9A
MPRDDDGESDVSALVFFDTNQSGSDDDGTADRQALIFAAEGDGDAPSGVDALRAQGTSQPVDAEQEDREGPGFLAKVTNPPGTVSITALPDGSVVQIELSPKVTSMTEAALVDEILAIAELARQKGLASQQAFVVDAVRALGLGPGDGVDDELIVGAAELPTPEQAEAAQAQVFASRYVNSD